LNASRITYAAKVEFEFIFMNRLMQTKVLGQAIILTIDVGMFSTVARISQALPRLCRLM
jgi:hypothetical protein